MPTRQHHYGKWSPRRLVYEGFFLLRRSIKRRMKGESRRQWIERNLQNSFMGIAVDITQSAFRYDMQPAASNTSASLTLPCMQPYDDVRHLHAKPARGQHCHLQNIQSRRCLEPRVHGSRLLPQVRLRKPPEMATYSSVD